MQYLVGLKYFQEEPIFSPELFVAVRKRIDKDFFNDIMLSMHRKQVKETEDSNKAVSYTHLTLPTKLEV